MIRGIDVSHWQGIIDWKKVKTDFVFMKATQGVKYVDPMFKENQKNARAYGNLCGFYHFAEGTDIKKEAAHFVKTIGELKQNEIVILDWEIEHENPTRWCREWLDEVKRLTGVKPILYTNEARVKSINWTIVVAGDYGLWVAKYLKPDFGIFPPSFFRPVSDEWPFWVLWQYSSKGKVAGITGNVDLNHGDISVEVLKKYGKQIPVEICKKCCKIHCPK